jgi:hypothetical protein
MNRSSAFESVIAAALACACGSKDPVVCENSNAFAAMKRDAQAVAETAYEPPVIQDCPELDPPLDGRATSIGLTGGEYAAILRGANGNFLDDHVWWVKAKPRGESHVVPMQITAEHCDAVSFDKFGYDYAFATPPLAAAPACGRYLTGIAVGHQLADSWPLIFGVEASGLIQLAPLSANSTFGGFLRIPGAPLEIAGRDSIVDRLEVVRHDGDSLELVARANGSTAVSALRLVLKAGDSSRLSVQLEIEPRAFADSPLIAVAALSGWFSEAEGHSFDRIRASFIDGTSFETALADPGLDWGNGAWTSVPVPEGATLDSLAFLQDRTLGDGNPRPNLLLSTIQSSVPIALDLSVTRQSPLAGNVVGNLLVDRSALHNQPIVVSYLITASPP